MSPMSSTAQGRSFAVEYLDEDNRQTYQKRQYQRLLQNSQVIQLNSK